ncbi:RNA-directed DNA polymerase from mobile element jockey-like [Brachionus plicatilis]|uniref:RNA-directed DNA polymerase from mobile element jockey-like n=1 Tax=Brachionus plicatilis TaxID=10195 RepID=A0A3M7R1A8_BRAPC|nr:RNA-directed DNA polymerase from mobile element jockey-like [Brachionus plicatilis]
MNKLSLHNDVVCIQEAWLTSKAQIDGLIYVQDKRVFYKKATRTSNKGRSSGGPHNIRDHLAINSEYQIHVMDNFPKIFATKPIKRPRINWEKPTEIELYQQKAEKHLANNTINEMSSALVNPVIKTSNQVKNENAKENKRKKKKKSWWNEEIQKIHKRIVAAYIEYKASNFEKAKRKAFSDAKKDFQRQKRLNRHQKKERRMRKLNEMYKMDRNRFWRTVKNLNKSEAKVDGKNAEEANKIVHDFINKNKNSVFEVNITPERIKSTINMLKNGTAVGFSDLSNEMFKHNNTDRLCNIGVKQGGPLSPKLFSIYMERLIRDIEKLDVGVEHNGQKINVICYADDILILSHTKRGLQKQLEVVEKYGKEMGIKYNPNKTSLMICNKKCRRSKSNQLEDIWQEELILDGVQIQKVDSVKYFGVEIHDTNRNKTHLDKRIRLALRSSARLKSMEIWTEHTNPYLKGHLCKTFVRPVLMCRTTNLLLALNIESTEVYIENMKTEFIIRLVGNDYTSHFINEMANEGTILQICDLMGHLFNEEKVTVEEIIGICRVSKYINENLTNSMRKENETVKVIRDIFKEKNRELMLNKLFEAIKF